MTALWRQVRAEIIKGRTIRSTYALLAGGVALALVTLAVLLIFLLSDTSTVDETTIAAVIDSAGRGWVFALLLGVIVSTGEFRHLTISGTLILHPNRATLLLAKAIAAAAAGALLALLSVAAVTVVAAVDLLGKAETVTIARAAGVQGLGSVLAFALAGIIGVGIGALLRVQVAAVIAVLVWVLAVEPIIALAWPAADQWMPGSAVTSLGATGIIAAPSDAIRAAIVLALMAATCLLAAMATSMRRDVTA